MTGPVERRPTPLPASVEGRLAVRRVGSAVSRGESLWDIRDPDREPAQESTFSSPNDDVHYCGGCSREPRRQLLGVRKAALPEPQVVPDLGAVELHRATSPVVHAQTRRPPRRPARRRTGRPHRAARRGHVKAGMPHEELQQEREPQPSGTTLTTTCPSSSSSSVQCSTSSSSSTAEFTVGDPRTAHQRRPFAPGDSVLPTPHVPGLRRRCRGIPLSRRHARTIRCSRPAATVGLAGQTL